MFLCGVYKPGVQSSQVNLNTYESGITATGTTQDGATLITKYINRVDTIAVTNRGVRLPPATPGAKYTIQNNAGNDNDLKVYPATDENFLGSADNAAVIVADGNQLTVFCYAATVWTLI